MQARNPLSIVTSLALAVMVCATVVRAQDAEKPQKVRLKAVMILASNRVAPPDSRLQHLESKLRRVFGFQHYKHHGSGSTSVTLPGDSRIDLGGGHILKLSAAKAEKNRVRVNVKWLRGKKSLLQTTVVMKKGSPTILGGPSHENGTLLIALQAN